jgi:hypothetical protein
VATAFLTHELVQECEPDCVDIIEALIASGKTQGRLGLHVFVADRTVPLSVEPTSGPSEFLLNSFFVGESDREDFFRDVAWSKLRISHRTGQNTYNVRLCSRLAGETRYYGSVVLGNLVVAASGFQAFYDELVCGQMAHLIQAEMKASAHDLEANPDLRWLT